MSSTKPPSVARTLRAEIKERFPNGEKFCFLDFAHVAVNFNKHIQCVSRTLRDLEDQDILYHAGNKHNPPWGLPPQAVRTAQRSRPGCDARYEILPGRSAAQGAGAYAMC